MKFKMFFSVLPLMFMTFLLIALEANSYSYHFYIFGSSRCSVCRDLKHMLEDLFGNEQITFYDLSTDKDYTLALERIYELLTLSSSEKSILLTGILVNNKIRAIIVGYHEANLWNKIIQSIPKNGLVLITFDYEKVISDENLVNKLTDIFINPKIVEKIYVENKIEKEKILSFIVTCAIADSINPCTFTVFTALLLITFHTSGKGKVFRLGLLFVTAIYLTYFLIGLNIIKVFEVNPYLKNLVGILGLLVGIKSLLNFVRKKPLSLIPNFLKHKIDNLLLSKPLSNVLSFMMGIIVSLTLLPCTSSPYLLALYIMGSLQIMDVLMLLTIYNFIFVTPLLLILLFIVFIDRVPRKLKIFRSKYTWLLSTIEGLILTALSLYIIFC